MWDLLIIVAVVVTVFGYWIGYFRVENVISITTLAVVWVLIRLITFIDYVVEKLEEIEKHVKEKGGEE
jgi:hypothetical protein